MEPPKKTLFPFMYILYRFLFVQRRNVALYILLLFATLYGQILDFSTERCMQRTGYIPLDELILVWPAPQKKPKQKTKNKQKTRPIFFCFIVTGKIALSYFFDRNIRSGSSFQLESAEVCRMGRISRCT